MADPHVAVSVSSYISWDSVREKREKEIEMDDPNFFFISPAKPPIIQHAFLKRSYAGYYNI